MSPVFKHRHLPRSLVILVQAVVGANVVVEIRHGVQVAGTLDSVDTNMNLTLTDATFTPPLLTKSPRNSAATALPSDKHSSQPFEMLYIASRHITFVHLPHDIDVFETVDNHVNKLQSLSYSNTGGKRRRRQ